MNCEDLGMLMADALGGELRESDRPAFEAHLRQCPTCRMDYETARKAVATMRELPGPQRITVERRGAGLVIRQQGAAGFSLRRYPRGLKPAVRLARGAFRYAAGLLLAFSTGYALHAALMMSDAASVGRPPNVETYKPQTRRSEPDLPHRVPVRLDAPPSGSLHEALGDAYARNPTRSDLAKCLIAMAHRDR